MDDPGSGQGFLDKLPFFKSVKNSVDRLVTRYEKVQVQIDRIEAELEKARMSMLKDIGMFDAMYEKNLEYFPRAEPLHRGRGREDSRSSGERIFPDFGQKRSHPRTLWHLSWSEILRRT